MSFVHNYHLLCGLGGLQEEIEAEGCLGTFDGTVCFLEQGASMPTFQYARKAHLPLWVGWGTRCGTHTPLLL